VGSAGGETGLQRKDGQGIGRMTASKKVQAGLTALKMKATKHTGRGKGEERMLGDKRDSKGREEGKKKERRIPRYREEGV